MIVRDERRAEALRRLKRAAGALFCAREEDHVMVNELACNEPGCPPIETVVALLRQGEPPWQVKVHKAVVDISDDDLLAAFGAKPCC